MTPILVRRVASLTAAAIACALLGGCAGQPTPQVSATAGIVEPSSPSPSPSDEPTPTKPAINELVVTPEGIGPLVPGQAPPVTDPTVDILIYVPDACDFAPEWDPSYVFEGDPGMWMPNYDIDPSLNAPGPFGVYVRDGLIDTIGVYDDAIKTPAGAHLGMTRDELLAVYPTGITLETEGWGIDTYRLRGEVGDLIFTLWDRDSGEFTVNQINVSHPGFTVPLGGSDYGLFGVCYGP